ncbi:1-(5-phosphoribosyl)-5-amino-4-imidazole-carboxylate carboxylase [candidate division KSB1 bacterium RBG_16_48_16]|nr:MAG: 1-(5-phosphoribosyl)-5-amino-4-imidazole-carboxylate carboxylase [candidate division KSB1 bacterium RBG_16_48_16]
MYKDNIKKLLAEVRDGTLDVEQALAKLQNLPYENLGFANVDHHRALRKGFPEVVFCQGKTTEQAVKIMQALAQHNDVLATRVSKEMAVAIREIHPQAEFNEVARTIVIKHKEKERRVREDKIILVLSAGTSDMPVAEEAVVTAGIMGNHVKSLYDVGVAGIHRLLNRMEEIRQANVLIVVAGMDGALPSVVAGLVNKPVIAVPTSVGYGASFGGVGPLLTMLNACAPGVTVVNIDNGFGAGYFASLINR